MLFDEKIVVTSAFASYIDFKKKKNVFVQGRAYHALSYRISGRVSIETEKSSFVSEKGSLTFVPKGLSYNTEIFEDGSMFVVHFTTDKELEAPETFLLNPTYPVTFYNMFSEITSRFKIGRENDLYCMSMFYGILAEARHEFLKSRGDNIPNAKLRAAKEHIDFGFSDPSLSVSGLAYEMGVSEAYFRRLFADAYGMAPNAYIKKTRIENAKAILRTGYYTVTETAIRCGFDSISYFSYEFHRISGVTPKEYAARFAQGN